MKRNIAPRLTWLACVFMCAVAMFGCSEAPKTVKDQLKGAVWFVDIEASKLINQDLASSEDFQKAMANARMTFDLDTMMTTLFNGEELDKTGSLSVKSETPDRLIIVINDKEEFDLLIKDGKLNMLSKGRAESSDNMVLKREK